MPVRFLLAGLLAQTLMSAPSEPFPDGFARGAYRVAPDVTAPVPKKLVAPDYTEEARQKQIVGEDELLVIVRPDGTVGPVKLLTSIGREFGLDEKAIKAASEHLFEPGRKAGVAVPVVATIYVEFTLPGVPRPLPRMTGGTADPPLSLPAGFARDLPRPGPGLLRPLPTAKIYPTLTAEQAARANGRVEMVGVVLPTGKVGDLAIARSAPGAAGLEDAVLAAVRTWEFEPPSKNGAASSVVLTFIVEFSRAVGR